MRTRYRDGRMLGPRFWFLLSAIALGVYLGLIAARASDDFFASATVIAEDTPGTGDIECYEIRLADGTAVTVMGSRAVPLIRYLKAHPKLTLELRPRTLQKVER